MGRCRGVSLAADLGAPPGALAVLSFLVGHFRVLMHTWDGELGKVRPANSQLQCHFHHAGAAKNWAVGPQLNMPCGLFLQHIHGGVDRHQGCNGEGSPQALHQLRTPSSLRSTTCMGWKPAIAAIVTDVEGASGFCVRQNLGGQHRPSGIANPRIHQDFLAVTHAAAKPAAFGRLNAPFATPDR